MTCTIAPVDAAAARHAVTHWHYSRTMPTGKLVKVGAWEHDRYIGVVLFGRGASPALVTRYGLTQTGGCELVRVALDRHTTPTSHIVAQALRYLHHHNPGLHLVVSFADEREGHIGTLYQAGNWIYAGTVTHSWYKVHGRLTHPKTLHTRYGIGGQSIPWLHAHVDPNATRVEMPPKHRYLMPLDRHTRRRIQHLAQPYPTRGRSVDGDTPGSPPGEAGSTPADRSNPAA